jgi:pimeloyl-ACP methyl ester carboxylesterase
MKRKPSFGSFLRALRFVLYCKINRSNRTFGYTQIRAGNRYLDANVFVPERWFLRGNQKGTIVVIHGMSAMGNSDPRIIAVCDAFARCGYVVVSPSFQDIANFSITDTTVQDIAETLEAVAMDRMLCRNGKIMVFAPSFSAGMALIASSHPRCAEIIESICSVGSYGSVHTVIDDLMKREDCDEYGRLIIMKNFIHYAPGFGPETGEVLCEAILDNGLKRKEEKFSVKLASLRESFRQRILRLVSDADFRFGVWNAIITRSRKVRLLMKRLSVIENISSTKARIALIHGMHDNVISPEESKSIFARLQELGVSSTLCITPLISHGDAQTDRGFFRHLFQLVSAFAFFFG